MSNPNHQLAQNFFAAVGAGVLPEGLVTADLTAWTLSSGETDKARFEGGIKMLAAVVEGELVYQVDAITAEDDRVVAEVSSNWSLINGDRAQNKHVFSFVIRDGKIARVMEYMDPAIPKEKLGPLIQKMMVEAAKQ